MARKLSRWRDLENLHGSFTPKVPNEERRRKAGFPMSAVTARTSNTGVVEGRANVFRLCAHHRDRGWIREREHHCVGTEKARGRD